MAILFSKVTISAEGCDDTFLASGIPREYDDLEYSEEFEDLMVDVGNATVQIHVEAYLYGDGESVRASQDDLVQVMDQMRLNPYFLETECDNIEDVDFSFDWCPDELFGQDFSI